MSGDQVGLHGELAASSLCVLMSNIEINMYVFVFNIQWFCFISNYLIVCAWCWLHVTIHLHVTALRFYKTIICVLKSLMQGDHHHHWLSHFTGLSDQVLVSLATKSWPGYQVNAFPIISSHLHLYFFTVCFHAWPFFETVSVWKDSAITTSDDHLFQME